MVRAMHRIGQRYSDDPCERSVAAVAHEPGRLEVGQVQVIDSRLAVAAGALQARPLRLRQRLARLAQGEARCPLRTLEEPREHLVGQLLGAFTQQPSDGLADEELAVVEERLGNPVERCEGFRGAAAQGQQVHQQDRVAQPEVVVRNLTLDPGRHGGMRPTQTTHLVYGQGVDQGPGARLAQQLLQPGEIVRFEQCGVVGQELHCCYAQLVNAARPSLVHEASQRQAVETGMLRAPGLEQPPRDWYGDTVVMQRALQVALLLLGPLRSPVVAKGVVEDVDGSLVIRSRTRHAVARPAVLPTRRTVLGVTASAGGRVSRGASPPASCRVT